MADGKVKITDLPSGSINLNSDAFVFEGEDGTQQISYADLVTALFENSLIGGAGTTITDATLLDGIKRYRINASRNQSITLNKDSWQGVSAPYTLTVVVTDMTSEIVPEIAPVISDVISTGLEENNQWAYITKAVSGNGTITFMCYETKPTINLNAIVKVM